MSDIYYEPANYGLETIGEIDWSSGCYEFDLTVVWRRILDGAFVYAEDSGCSCPGKFEDTTPSDLLVLRKRGGLGDLKAHLEKRNAEGCNDGDRSVEIATLLERMHAAGAR